MRILFIIYDNESWINIFPLGPAYLISVLEEKGYRDITVYHQNIYHYPEEHLVEYLSKNHFDAVGIGLVAGYYEYRKLLKICAAIHKVPNKPIIILGGHGPSPIPEFYLRKTEADIIVMGEGEIILPNVMDALSADGPLDKIRGIAYRQGNEVVVNERDEPVKVIDNIPFPAWNYFPMEHYCLRPAYEETKMYRNFPILSCRGCIYRCNFCYRMEKGWRLRTLDSIIEEMKILNKDYGINFFRFMDELLMGTENRAAEFSERILKEDLDIVFDCNGRVNVARNLEVLKLMKRAGCVVINYGVESLDQSVLDKMNKKQTVSDIYAGVENTITAGIQPWLNVLFGNIGDTTESLKKGLEFLLKYDPLTKIRYIKPVTPYPGCDLYYYAIENGLLDGPSDFYENKHLNSDLIAVNFTEIPDDEVYKLLFGANKILLEKYYGNAKGKAIGGLENLYFKKDVSYRGVRHR